MFAKLDRFKDLMNIAAKRREHHVIDYLVSAPGIDSQLFKDQSSTEELKNKILKYLEEQPKVERIVANIKIEFDKEHSEYRLICETKVKDYPRIFNLTANLFAQGGEIYELRRIKLEIDDIALGP